MQDTTLAGIANRLIERLPHKDRKQLLEHCESVDMVFGEVLCNADEPYRHVYFPTSACIALVTQVGTHLPFQTGLIGHEGILGATMAMGINTVPLRAVVQASGTSLRIPAQLFRNELRSSTVLTLAINRYLYILMAQISQTAVCTSFHDIEARLARWLLMMHDRAQNDHFQLTHAQLAAILGVRRSGVTIAAGVLQHKAVIRYVRGDITILNRSGLEAASCECYAALSVGDGRAALPKAPGKTAEMPSSLRQEHTCPDLQSDVR